MDSNNIIVEIDNEISEHYNVVYFSVYHNLLLFIDTTTLLPFVVTIHKFIRDKYSQRFPELESLVPTPLEYIKTVQV